MRSDITPGQTSDYLGFDLVMDDNLPGPCVLLADRGYDSDKFRKSMEAQDGDILRSGAGVGGYRVFR